MCTIVTSSDMTSFIYIGDEKHHLSKWLGKEKKWPPAKRNCVLVFFDARHPEPGAMIDTLDHLVSNTIKRPDAGKFLYILNQIDTTAREDNPEEVVAAWQRALGERGLTAGRFYTVYNPDAAVPIDDENIRNRFEGKRDADLGEIHFPHEEVEIERAYRIVGALEKTARDIEEHAVPAIQQAIESWKRRVLWGDAVVFGLLFAVLLGLTSRQLLGWTGVRPALARADSIQPRLSLFKRDLVAVVVFGLHYLVRALAAGSMSRFIRRLAQKTGIRGDLAGAFSATRAPGAAFSPPAPQAGDGEQRNGWSGLWKTATHTCRHSTTASPIHQVKTW